MRQQRIFYPFISTSTKEILWQGRGLGEEVNDITVQEYCAKHAIFYADALIEELINQQS